MGRQAWFVNWFCSSFLYINTKKTKLIARLVVPALQSIWFYNTKSDVWYEHFLIKRSGSNKPSSLIIRCVVPCIQTLSKKNKNDYNRSNIF